MSKFEDTTRLTACPLCEADVADNGGLARHLPECPVGNRWRPGESWTTVVRRVG